MAHLKRCVTLFAIKNLSHSRTNHFSRYVAKEKTSKAVRQRFLDYFINQHNHTFVRSSPVVPFCDPTVPFVNAGMNQFKGVFLGTKEIKHEKVANSQKCVRIGGKHNDLSLVGTDGYHHTFFEMLGNWSFGVCDKRKACELAWNLLTEVFHIHPSVLYVTYFQGNEDLEPDLECKEIWKSIGVSQDRILPFGIEENFWEMGLTGPCGPCTEIHIDRLGTMNRAKFVNRGLHDLTELWNIVFIQTENGEVKALTRKHVDTGMGLERLVAVIQGTISNYDTDLFTHLIDAVQKICKSIPSYEGKYGEQDWNSLDTSYRILADHSRTITACLADGMIPEQNQKLRRLIRRAFRLSATTFQYEKGLLKELTNYVVESLGSVYPEMERKITTIHQIIDYEEDLYSSLQSTSAEEWKILTKNKPNLSDLDVTEMPGLIRGFKEIDNLKTDAITPQLGHKLYDTHGLDEETISTLSEAMGLKFDVQGFRNEMKRVKMRSKEMNKTDDIFSGEFARIKNEIKATEDGFKYNYKRVNGDYAFDDLEVEVVALLKDERMVNSVEPNVNCSLILDRTNFYCDAGGQERDSGTIKLKNGEFVVKELKNVQNYILHSGVFQSNEAKSLLRIGDRGTAKIDKNRRIDLMRNHTAVHLLNAALKTLNCATCQKSSHVASEFLSFDVGIFGNKLSVDDTVKIENLVNRIIKEAVEVKTTEVDSELLYSCDDVTLIPGEVYPESKVRLIEIVGKSGFVSREPCCGTHVHNTADLQDFAIIGFKSLGRSTSSLVAVTGPKAKLVKENGVKMAEQVTQLQKNVDDNIDKPEVLEEAVQSLKKKLKEDSSVLPVFVKAQCSSYLNCIDKQIKQIAKGTLKEFVEMEMQNVLQTNKNRTKRNQEYVVHYLRCSMIIENVPLQKATKLCPDLPVLVIAYADGTVKARCCVPKKIVTDHFDAEKWLNSCVAEKFKSSVFAPKGQDPSLICNMKAKKVNLQEWDTLLKQSLEAAKQYIEAHL